MRYIIILILSLLLFSGLTTGQQTGSALPNPCAASEQRQLDFWVGEWDLTWPGNKAGEVQHGTNSIRRVLDGCVVEENFSGESDMHLRGKSISIFDTRAGKWKQTWVDNEGGYLDFVGEFKDGQMILGREVTRPDGRRESREWCSRTSAPTNSIGVGKGRKTAGRHGRWCGRSTTSVGSRRSFSAKNCDSSPRLTISQL